ncbi:MAG: ferritin-like domain-containing protein [Rhodoferax sp.]|nr:ferritin-like domain-containing protein [Rhodoferax sp.]
MELREQALAAFMCACAGTKTQATLALGTREPTGTLDCARVFPPHTVPGRPQLPTLVEPKEVPRRSPFTAAGHAALVHSIAHIEFNAIDLALDCVWRFANMPAAFYRDWIRVATEEAQHFMLLEAHLRSMGYRYGDFPAHTGLWTMCANTAHDVVARMALVPRTLEARGLDATPLIQAKLDKVGTPTAMAAQELLHTILRDEIGHVAIGNHWYHWLCHQREIDPAAFYAQAATRYAAPQPKPPFNYAARLAAGFTEEELATLDRNAGVVR